ncbi:hypothetical protein ACWEEK_27160 [Micromonospora aurantiaca (nom. illeg.)]
MSHRDPFGEIPVLRADQLVEIRDELQFRTLPVSPSNPNADNKGNNADYRPSDNSSVISRIQRCRLS